MKWLNRNASVSGRVLGSGLLTRVPIPLFGLLNKGGGARFSMVTETGARGVRRKNGDDGVTIE